MRNKVAGPGAGVKFSFPSLRGLDGFLLKRKFKLPRNFVQDDLGDIILKEIGKSLPFARGMAHLVLKGEIDVEMRSAYDGAVCKNCPASASFSFDLSDLLRAVVRQAERDYELEPGDPIEIELELNLLSIDNKVYGPGYVRVGFDGDISVTADAEIEFLITSGGAKLGYDLENQTVEVDLDIPDAAPEYDMLDEIDEDDDLY